ncbi:MAG: tripartite tricarboxylate transporter substrate binding protein, partial [Lautropia sp.]
MNFPDSYPKLRPFFAGRRGVVRFLLAATVMALGPAPVLADDAAFPQKPVSIVVPFSAGGSLDLTARILAEHLTGTLGQRVLVVNRPGAGSSVGARSVASAAPDGYTLFLTSGSAYGFVHLLVRGYEYQLSDFVPIAGVANNTSLFAVNGSLPAKTLQDLVAAGRDKPGTLTFCTTGVGGLNHLQLEMFTRQVKATNPAFEVTHVPYNGVAPALTGLRAGDVQACALPYSALVKNLDGKDIRVLAVQRSKRLNSLPQVPTTGEQGYPGMDGNDALVNLAAPKGTPTAVLEKL